MKATGVDSLAIAIGTSHGAFKFKGEPHLRFDILEKVPRSCRASRSCSTALPPSCLEYVQMINQYGGNIPALRGVPEGCCARRRPWLSARSTWTPTCVWR